MDSRDIYKIYDAILVVTFKKQYKDPEMIASDLSMREKYQGNTKAKFMLPEVDQLQGVGPVDFAQAMADAIGGDFNQPRRLGIYLGTHSDIAGNPEIPAEFMGGSVGYLATRHNFVISKICVDACYSGGGAAQPETARPVEDTLAQNVAKHMVAAIKADKTDGEPDDENNDALIFRKSKVAGCRVAGYCVVVKRYIATHEHFSGANAKNYKVDRPGVPQAVYGKGTLQTLRPRMPQGKFDLKMRGKKVAVPDKGTFGDIENLDQSSDFFKFIQKANAYFALKKAWKVTNDMLITPISLREYTDNPVFSEFEYDQQGKIVKFKRGDVLFK
jgi:hypothetical protein